MKTIKMIVMGLLFGLFLMGSSKVYAQDPVKLAPNNYKKVLIDNEQTRVVDFEIAPGETIPWHSHPNHLIYALTSGKIEITDKGKTPTVADIKMGDAMYMPAVTHMAKNTGTTTVKLVIVEIKPMTSK